jgi:hypothetical protein
MFEPENFARTVAEFHEASVNSWHALADLLNNTRPCVDRPVDMLLRGTMLAIDEGAPWRSKYLSILKAYSYGLALTAGTEFALDQMRIRFAKPFQVAELSVRSSERLAEVFFDLRLNDLPLPNPANFARCVCDYVEQPYIRTDNPFISPLPAHCNDILQKVAAGPTLTPSRSAHPTLGRFIAALRSPAHGHLA